MVGDDDDDDDDDVDEGCERPSADRKRDHQPPAAVGELQDQIRKHMGAIEPVNKRPTDMPMERRRCMGGNQLPISDAEDAAAEADDAEEACFGGDGTGSGLKAPRAAN